MCPTEACTSYSGPRYFAIVFAFAGDSTITSFFVPGTRVLLQQRCSFAVRAADPAHHTQAGPTLRARRPPDRPWEGPHGWPPASLDRGPHRHLDTEYGYRHGV